MNEKILIFLVVVLVVVGGYFYLQPLQIEEVDSFKECVEAGYPVMESYPRKCTSPDGQGFTEDIGNLLEKEDMITVSTPRPNAEVESPLSVEGEARGTWFFEADFGVKLVNEQGEVITEAPATADGDWMTEEFVPFSTELEFETPQEGEGRLILEKANPSGLEENADQVEFPVEF